ncbi:tRNA(fMet)-specific endonuclease VapC [soil metagenome]
MNVLLDTDTCIYLIRQRPSEVLRRFEEYEVGEIGLSSITVAELYFGVRKSQRPNQNGRALEQFLLPLENPELGLEAAVAYGEISSSRETGRPHRTAGHAHRGSGV